MHLTTIKVNLFMRQLFRTYLCVNWLYNEVCWEAQSVPQRQSIVRLVTVVRLSTACHILGRQDFNVNNAGHDTDIPEVTLLITLKH